MNISLFRTTFVVYALTGWAACGIDDATPTVQISHTVTPEDVASLGPGEHLRVDLSEGGVRIDNRDGKIDFTKIEVLDARGDLHIAEAILARTFDRENGEFAHVLSLYEKDGEIFPIYSLGNYQIVYESSSYDLTWWKSPTAYCPAGKSLLGMGSEQVFSASGHILYRGMIPTSLSAAQVAYQEDLPGYNWYWSATAYAICASSLPGLVKVESASSNNSTASKTSTVTCPVGKYVVGAGGTISGGDGRVKVDGIRPESALTQVTAIASEDNDGTTGNWLVRAYAICATAPAGLLRVSASAALLSSGSAVATCPAGKTLLGTGAEVVSSNRTNFRIMKMFPYFNSTSGLYTTRGGTGGATGTFFAYAICADT